MNTKTVSFRSLFAAFRLFFSTIGKAFFAFGKRCLLATSQALPEFVLSFGMLPSPTKDPEIEAWIELKKRHARRRKAAKRPQTEFAKVLPITGSTDDPFLRITM
ncbi:MAG TPA: hypothetical protein PKE31_09585 [Pseudomonadota bacterium]|jgi:hypothetical protein|nr:hypothetical protein [Pseudomonadota bacterium]